MKGEEGGEGGGGGKRYRNEIKLSQEGDTIESNGCK